jgi:hypothetical protein
MFTTHLTEVNSGLVELGKQLQKVVQVQFRCALSFPLLLFENLFDDFLDGPCVDFHVGVERLQCFSVVLEKLKDGLRIQD